MLYYTFPHSHFSSCRMPLTRKLITAKRKKPPPSNLINQTDLLPTNLLLLYYDQVTEVNLLKSLSKDATRQTVWLQFINCHSILGKKTAKGPLLRCIFLDQVRTVNYLYNDQN